MGELTALRLGFGRRLWPLARLGAWILLALFALLVVAFLVFFAVHAAQILAFPYPLDYGEGPLLAQVTLLRDGAPPWALYADPAAPPYLVVNYPPVYPLLAAGLGGLIGGAGVQEAQHAAPLLIGGAGAAAPLLAGRLVSLAATIGAAVALWLLAGPAPGDSRRARGAGPAGWPAAGGPWSAIARLLIVLSFLALPIVREWAVVMRVDMLGVALGLWGLVCVRLAGEGRPERGDHERRSRATRHSSLIVLAALLFVLSLYTKPSLIAAPGAAIVWLLLRDRRRGALLLALMAAGGGLLFVALQLASGGWFALHVLTANVNDWRLPLAEGFWREQLAIHWPIFAAALLGAAWGMLSNLKSPVTLAILYTLLGAIGAIGAGKVGAYLNYFLELYAGLIWLAALAIGSRGSEIRDQGSGSGDREDRAVRPARSSTADLRPRAPRSVALPPSFFLLPSSFVLLLLAAGLVRYYPLWSEEYLKPYGLIERQRPPRVALGGYGVWDDLRREREVLAALGRINAELVPVVEGAGAPIFTDLPGIAAQAGVLSRLQAFEHRQLYDAGAWDQRGLLLDMAGGRVPLVVLDYLGNWLTPEMIALITHRYAQEGSIGIYDIYRPIDLGPLVPREATFGGVLRLGGYRLAPTPGVAHEPGSYVTLGLALAREDRSASGAGRHEAYAAIVQLRSDDGAVVAEAELPLLYGALHPSDWPAGVSVEHVHPLRVPDDLRDGSYTLLVGVRAAGRELGAAVELERIVVRAAGGRGEGRFGYFVPGPLRAARDWLGGAELLGEPQMPAMPIAGATLQCFTRGCVELRGGSAALLPLGERIMAGDGRPGRLEGADGAGVRLRELWEASGGEAVLGPRLGEPMRRGDTIVQYTRYARLELPPAGPPRLAPLGEEYLRLPNLGPYRWPGPAAP